MKLQPVAAFAALALLLPGCASIIEGTTESIAVTTPPIEGAKCVLKSSEGTYYVTTPGNATVHKTKHDLNVECDKDGYQHASQKVESHFNGATAGNIIAGGLIGAGVDAATGADYNYPTDVTVPMKPVAAVGTSPTPAPSAVQPASATGKPTS
jgi:hypothetical protein